MKILFPEVFKKVDSPRLQLKSMPGVLTRNVRIAPSERDSLNQKMNPSKSIIVGLIAGLAGCILAQGANSNPYTAIADRNVFGLVQPEVVVPSVIPEAPIPQVTVNGIMTVFGRPQVLFKMTIPASPGAKGRELYFVLGEGERKEGVRIIKINFTTGTVTLDNQGTRQQILLVNR